MNTQEKNITLLYTGYMGRAADSSGFDFWLAQANSGAQLLDIAYSFSQTSEYQSMYGGLSNGGLVDKIYLNLFDRAADPDGRAYWINELNNGKPSARLIVDMISGAQDNDRVILENTATAAKQWMDYTPGPFSLPAAVQAIDTLNEQQGAGITINITSTELLPWTNEITAAMKDAWQMWDSHFATHGRLDVDVGYLLLEGTGRVASASNRMEVQTIDSLAGLAGTRSGVAHEVITGLDPNGVQPDGFMNLHMAPAQIFGQFHAPSVFAHEIGHMLGFRAVEGSDYMRLMSSAGGQVTFNGAHTVEAYGGPMPIPVQGSFIDWAHFDDGRALMYPYSFPGVSVGVSTWDLAALNDLGVGIA